jgi:transposase
MINNLSNALVESTNTKLRVLHRMAFGFKKPEHLIALALLDRGGYCPPLPGRTAA